MRSIRRGHLLVGGCLCGPPIAYGCHQLFRIRALHLDTDGEKYIDKVKSLPSATLDTIAEKKDDVISWPDITTKITNAKDSLLEGIALPEYARRLPGFAEDMYRSFNFEKGSMGAKIREESRAHVRDQDAKVRLGPELCPEEQGFLQKRSQFTRKALARYLDIPEADIDEADIPIIGIAGSGGGLRACLATASYYERMKNDGLLDTVTYMAAVSGSTWAQSLYMTLGKQEPKYILRHLKKRVGRHIADPVAGLDTLLDKVTAPYVLTGVFERIDQGYKDFGLVDLYGLMLSARFMVPNNQLIVDKAHMRISSQAKILEEGENPMPIYTCVRSEIPKEAREQAEEHHDSDVGKAKEIVAKSYFQFFEITPYEFGSEDLAAWIPTWAMGRKFKDGTSITRSAETSLTTLLGTFSSAFCASLSLYWKEIKPLVPDSGIFKTISDQIALKDNDLKKIHLVDATKIPNYVKGMSTLPTAAPDGITEINDLELADSGMEQNIPFYPLLRRQCDIIIAIDSSADIDTTPWFERTEGWVKQRQIRGWPIGAGWPKSSDSVNRDFDEASTQSTIEAKAKVNQARRKRYALEGINIWVGQSAEAESEHAAKPIEDDFQTVSGSTGLMLIYLPLLPHPRVPDVDPASSEYLSTWNCIYTPQQVDSLRDLTSAHYDDGAVKIKRAVRAMYLRKRANRLQASNVAL